jgi:fused signal recognition particle receptor
MFRFFKKKPDLPDPIASEQQPDSEVGQTAPETSHADLSTDITRVPEPTSEQHIADEGTQGADQTAPVIEDVATEAPRGGLLSRWFKRNPEKPPSGVEDQTTPEQLDDQSVPQQEAPDQKADLPATAAWDSAAPDQQSVIQTAQEQAGVSGASQASLDESSSEFEDEQDSDEQDSDEQGEAQQKVSWLAKLRGGLAKTGKSIGGIFVGVRVDEALFEELETALIMADTGVEATEQLLTAVRLRVKQERIEDAAEVKQALREVLADHLRVLEKPFEVGRVKPLVVMMTGVNGAGKTTSIGKLAFCLQKEGARVLLAAGDTFRAAARQQLVEWGSRNHVDVIAQDGGDPAAVAFDAVNAGRARGMDVVMVDTAGRLPTQLHLMDELKKIRRVIAKADPTAPHEVLLVVDGNQGQNVLSQIRAFDAAVGLTGLIVTKLDGTAKGGTLAAVAAGAQGVRPIPVYWIGVGERIEDLQPFVAAEFAAAVVGQ